MLQRRDFIKALSACGAAGLIPATLPQPALGNVRSYQLTAGKSA
ncbi:MAG: twin-arginine translocation signal domain-containing protein, partial [Alphaproteobacteria bacterium]|nr:twin-arginine translocation signal domain-containing protein [Alphaproteobacteria bacterium]